MKKTKMIVGLLSLLIFAPIDRQANADSKEKSQDSLMDHANELIQANVPHINMDRMIEENPHLKSFLDSTDQSTSRLSGKRVAIIADNGVEEIELTLPKVFFEKNGATVDVIAPKMESLPKKFGLDIPAQRSTHILAVQFFKNSGWVKIDRNIENTDPKNYDLVFIPGGAWSPDLLRGNAAVQEFIQKANSAEKLIASICHGPWVLIDAGVTADKKVTAYWSIKRDIVNSGAEFVDAEVVEDGNLLTSRYPFDLPALLKRLEKRLISSEKQ